MKTRLKLLLGLVEAEAARAETLAGSDNETTAEKWEPIAESLRQAADSLREAVEELDGR